MYSLVKVYWVLGVRFGFWGCGVRLRVSGLGGCLRRIAARFNTRGCARNRDNSRNLGSPTLIRVLVIWVPYYFGDLNRDPNLEHYSYGGLNS